MRAGTSRRSAAAAAVAVVALVATGCSDSSTGEGGQAVNTSAASADSNLKGVCPDTVVIQTDWWPQAEYGGLYRLVGTRPTIDGNKNLVTGALVDNGADTGVKVEIRSGGPANNFTPSAALLYTDDSVLLGGADLDQVAQLSGSGKPVLPVFAPLDLNPVVLMWDPAQHPQFNTIADIGQTDTKVLYFQGSTYMQYLVGAGLLRQNQVSASYAGTPDQWASAKGSIVQQGFLTNEVINYPENKQIWGKPVKYQLVADSGYPNYPATLTIRPDKKTQLTPCLKKLVPVLQRSTAAYKASPGATNQFISEVISKFPKAYPYPKKAGDAAAKIMVENDIVGNGRNSTIGDFDSSRLERMLQIVRPIFAAQKTPVKDGLTAEQLATNEFIDPTVGAK